MFEMKMQEETALLSLAYRRGRYVFLYSLLVAVLMVAALWGIVAHGKLLAWLASIGLIMSSSTLLAHFYLRHGRGVSAVLDKWKNALIAASAIAGMGWGSSILILPTYAFDLAYLLSLFVIASGSAFACVVISPVRPAATAFLFMSLSPLAVSLLSVGESFQHYMGVIVMAYLVFMLLLARQMHHAIRTSLSLTELNTELLGAIQANNQRMSQYFKNSPGFFYTLLQRPDGRYAMPFASAGIRDLFGIDPADVAEDIAPLAALAHPDDAEMTFRKTVESAQNLTPYHVEYRIVHPQNGVRWIEAYSSPHRMPDGGTRWDGYMHDVTGRKQLESQLLQREQAFSTLAENAPVTILRYDRQCRLVYHNSHFEVVLGGSVAGMSGKTPRETVSDARYDIYEAALRRVISSGQDAETYLAMQDRYGDEGDYHFCMTAELDDSGKVTSVLVIGYDITLSKRREEALRRSESEYRTLAENSPDNIIRYDRECRIRYLNKNLESTLGIPTANILGKTASEIFSDGLFDELENVIGQVIASGQAADYDVILPDTGSGERHHHLRLTPERDEHGAVNGVLSIGRDITERKRMEDELRAQADFQRTLLDAINEVGLHLMLIENGKVIYFGNSKRATDFGLSSAEIEAGVSLLDYIHPDDRARVADMHRRRLAGEVVPSCYEYAMLTPGGERRAYEVYAAVIPGTQPPRTVVITKDINERKRMEETLAAREQEYRTLAENLPDNIARWDVQGRYLYINSAHERTLGVAASEVIGKPIFAMHEHVKAAIAQVVATGQAVKLVRQPVPVDGEMQIHEVSLVPERDAAGRIVSVLGLGRDMTELYRVQDEVTARERQLRALADSSPGMMGAFYARPDGSICMPYASPNLEELFGLRPQDLVNDASPLLALNHPDDAPMVEETIAESARTMTTWHVEFRILHPTKGLCWMESNTKPEPHPDGGIVWYGYVHDITERKRMEEALAAREQAFRSLAESSPDVVIRVDRDLRIRYLNTNMVNYLELGSAEEVIGRQSIEIWPDGRFNEIDALRERVVVAGKMESIELAVPVLGGKMAYHQVISVPERDADGHIIGTITFGRDITAIRETERRLSGLVENLPGIAYALSLSPEGGMRFPYVSAGVEEIYGITSEAAMGDFAAMHGLIHPDDKPGMEALFAESARAMAPFRAEVRICPSGQPERWLDVRSDPQAQPDGSILWYGLIFDITERKRMEEALQESEIRCRHNSNLLNSVLESASDVIVFALDRNYRYIAFNRTHKTVMQAIWGKEIFLGMSMLEVIGSHNDSKAAKQGFDRALAGESFVLEEEYGDEHLSRQCWQNHWAPIRSDAGEVIGLTCYVMNITARKQAQQQLELLDRAIDMSADAIFMMDEQLRFNYVNATACRALGYSREELLAMDPCDIDPDMPREVILKFMKESPLGSLSTFETRHRAKDGRTYPVEISGVQFEEGGARFSLTVARDITARHHLEQALAERERHFRSLAENSLDVIVRYDLELRRTYINPAWALANGIPVEEALGKRPTEMAAVVSDSAREFEDKLRKVLESGAPGEIEFGGKDHLGNMKYFSMRVVPEYGKDGSVASLLTVANDITERKRVENVLRHSREMLADAQKLALLGSWDWDVVMNRVEWSEMAYEIYTPDQRPAEPGFEDFTSSLHPDDRERVVAAVQAAFEHDTPFDLDHRVVSVSRGVRTVHAQGRVFRDADGKPFRMVGTVQDISERKRAEAELQNNFKRISELNVHLEQNARDLEEQAVELEISKEQLQQTEAWYRSILQSAPDGMLIVDSHGLILQVNAQLEAMFGYEGGELPGCSIEVLLPHAARAVHVDYRAEFVSSRQRERRMAGAAPNLFGCRKDGSEFPVDVSLSRLPDLDGRVGAICAAVRDVSERRKMDVAREAALSEALRLAQLRSAFMAQMSHELRTPLNGILGYTQNLLHGDALGEKQLAGLHIIQQSGEHLLTLINGILDHAAIEADKFELVPGDIELELFLGTLIGIIRIRAEQKNLAFTCEADAALPAVVRGDAQRLRQVLLNLLSNAVKFTDSGQVSLRVNYIAPSRLHFAVQDSGVGIAAGQLENIFLPFEQAGEISRRAGGTGLGLAISRKLVRLMGGDIRVESQPGTGSTFSFEIEMESAQSGAMKVNAAALAEQAATRVAQAIPMLPVPPKPELDILHGMALRGSMRDVIRHAEQLAEADGCYLPFADQLRQLSKSFQTKALLSLIEQYRSEKELEQ